MKQQSQKISITKRDAIEQMQIVDRVCTYAQFDKEAYLNIFFEVGCRLATMTLPDHKDSMRLLTDKRIGFWAWYMVEYIRHDDMFHAAAASYRNYSAVKINWSKTYKLQNHLLNYLKFKDQIV